MSNLLIERHGEVTLFTLNRPEVHNNGDRDLAVELAEGITEFAEDESAKVLVVTGAGEKAFCAGANLKGMNELWEHPYTYSAGPMGFARLDPGKPTTATRADRPARLRADPETGRCIVSVTGGAAGELSCPVRSGRGDDWPCWSGARPRFGPSTRASRCKIGKHDFEEALQALTSRGHRRDRRGVRGETT